LTIEKFNVKGNLIVKTGEVGTYDKIKLYNYNYLLGLKDKRIIIFSGNRLYNTRRHIREKHRLPPVQRLS
jgi:hypothetical protein